MSPVRDELQSPTKLGCLTYTAYVENYLSKSIPRRAIRTCTLWAAVAFQRNIRTACVDKSVLILHISPHFNRKGLA